MDDYGTQYLLLHGAGDFATRTRQPCAWDDQAGVFRLVTEQPPRLSHSKAPHALAAWLKARPLLRDQFGQLGMLSDDNRGLLYSTRWPASDPQPVLAEDPSASADSQAELALAPVAAPEGSVFLDLALGGDGRVALGYSNGDGEHGVLLVQLGRRWQRRCTLASMPARVLVDGDDRVWAANDQALSLCVGEPLPQPYEPRPERFEPVSANPHPLRRLWQRPLPDGHGLLAICQDGRSLHLLTWQTSDDAHGYRQFLISRPLDEDRNAALQVRALPRGLPFAVDVAALTADRLVLMLARETEAEDPYFERRDLPLVELLDGRWTLQQRRYPQHSQAMARFISGHDGQLRYLTADGPRELHPLAQVHYPARGMAQLQAPLDAGSPDTLWHRVCLDACIPPGCRLELAVHASDTDTPPEPPDLDDPDSDQWHRQPAPVWSPLPSELPFHQGHFAPQRNRQGLFEILLQRPDGAVRDIRGRYLWLCLQLYGDGRHSPAIHAMRVYYPRFSWQQAYLPDHFHQQQRPDDQPADANGADLRERLLACLEGMHSPIEQRIASAECWLYPHAAPREQLATLAGMLGTTLPPHWPEHRQRRWLASLGTLQHRRGSFAGLCLALDIATDGAVARGQVVPVEDYRLRRTLATILGIDMDDRDHPLTLGTSQSGNSRVGESLILSDEQAREFLALFAPELAESAADRAAVASFFDRYAFQLSVLLHGPAKAQRAAVEAALAEHCPAHVQWRIRETDHPFVLGLSPLLGIDTYLEPEPVWRRVVLDYTRLGRDGLLRNPAALSPEQAGPVSPRGKGS